MNPSKALAGLLTYSPGPGLYSRMERAVQQMPKVIRTQELPGLLRKYKDGVPGWEVKAVAPALEGVQSISRQDLLDLIQQHSPAYTHREIVLGGRPQMGGPLFDVPEYQGSASRIGEGRGHGMTRYGDYSQGGQDYGELLLLQPGAKGIEFGSHWGGHPQVPGTSQAVAHARYDTHGDALRINELQSDLGINNRKAREFDAAVEAASRAGNENELMFLSTQEYPAEYPFPLEDDWADILIKRLALEAARQGHRAIEVASPRAIADTVGGSIDNYEHFYGKVVPGAIERLGRKMGGLAEVSGGLDPDPPPFLGYQTYDRLAGRMTDRAADATRDAIALADGWAGGQRGPASVDVPLRAMIDYMISEDLPLSSEDAAAAFRRNRIISTAQDVHDRLVSTAMRNGYPEEAARTLIARAMPGVMRDAENAAALWDARNRLYDLADIFEHAPLPQRAVAPGRRYIMSDAMRKRILRDGIGMSVMGAAATDPDAVLERLQEQ